MGLKDIIEKNKKERAKKERKKVVKKVAIGSISGLLAGMVGGVLFAPKSGRETREEISNASKEAAQNAKNKANDLKSKTEETADTLKNKTLEAKSKIAEYIKEKKAAATIKNISSDEEELEPVSDSQNDELEETNEESEKED